jgi:hypothetical protein
LFEDLARVERVLRSGVVRSTRVASRHECLAP